MSFGYFIKGQSFLEKYSSNEFNLPFIFLTTNNEIKLDIKKKNPISNAYVYPTYSNESISKVSGIMSSVYKTR